MGTVGFAQGTIHFGNLAILGGVRVVDGPVYAEDGATALLGTTFQAALYAGALGTPVDQLRMIGPAVPFSSVTSAAGYFALSRRVLNENGVQVAPGAPATVQVRVWRLADGLTWEDAVAAGRGYTSSDLLNLPNTGCDACSPASPPALMIGLHFSAPLVPEPSPFSFASLILAAVVTGYHLKRRRQHRSALG